MRRGPHGAPRHRAGPVSGDRHRAPQIRLAALRGRVRPGTGARLPVEGALPTEPVAPSRHSAIRIGFAGLLSAWFQAEIGADRRQVLEPRGVVDRMTTT